MARDEFDDEGLEPEELDPAEVETTDGAWEQERRATRGGRRWLLLLLVIPLVALVVAQLGPDQTPEAVPTPTRSSAETWAAWPPPSPTRAGPPMVSQLRRPFVGGGASWDLFARTDRSVVRVQVPSGRVTTTPLPRIESGGPVAFLPTRAGVIVRPMDSVPGYVVPDDERATQLTGALADGGPVLPGPDLGHVWVGQGYVNRASVELVRTDGHRTGASIAEPRQAIDWITRDGGGYPMVRTSGGVYDLRPDSLRRITTGQVLAAGPTGWLVAECDKPHRCSWVVVDRPAGRSPVRSNDRHVLPGRASGNASGVIAPDGRHALLVGVEKGLPGTWLLDLRSGKRQRIDVVPLTRTFVTADVAAWTPDSRWVVLVDAKGGIVAVDAATRKVRHLDLDLPDVHQIAVRPDR